MRNLRSRVFLTMLGYLIFLCQFGCGSETPFRRGAETLATPPPPGGPSPASEPKGLNKEFFEKKVQKGFSINCNYCHNGIKKLLVADSFETASKHVVFGNPEKSDLYLAASGQRVQSGKDHGPMGWGDEPEEVENLKNLRDWILGKTLADEQQINFLWIEDRNLILQPLALGELNKTYFDSKVRGLIEDSCTMCHDNPAPDYSAASSKVVFGKPEDSLLYLAGSGQILPSGWKHKNIWRNNPDNLEILKSWIMGAEL